MFKVNELFSGTNSIILFTNLFTLIENLVSWKTHELWVYAEEFLPFSLSNAALPFFSAALKNWQFFKKQ